MIGPQAWRFFARIKTVTTTVVALLFIAGCSSSNNSNPASPPPPPPPPPPATTVSIANASLAEGNSGTANMDFTVSLSASSSVQVSVDYATSDDTATAGSDYTATSGTLDFAAGTTSQTISVPVSGDSDIESTESFVVSLTNPVSAMIGQASATGTILNDDGIVGGPSGLPSRPSNLTCVAPPRPTQNATVTITDPFPANVSFNQPTKMLLEPVANPRWFVLEKPGRVVTFDPANPMAPEEYLDLSGIIDAGGEGGMLGMAFHPDYPNTREIFLSYTIDYNVGESTMRSVISRFILDDVNDPGAGTVEQVIIEINQDFTNHNGGDIAFGPGDYLFIGLGDGGSGGDPRDRAQDTTRLLGSMLRIGVIGTGAGYTIPSDNPFVQGQPVTPCGPGANANSCPEIYAWGLRNPWRWSFDPATNELWLADVGQGAYEEVDIIELGGNYGWRCREGAHDFNMTGCGTGLIDPITEYGRGDGNSITGGFVYRGSAIPELVGRYIFADYGSGRFWALQSGGQGGYFNDEISGASGFGPTSFGVGADGELYFTDINSGRIRFLEPAGAGNPDTIPDLLSQTGCTDPTDVTAPYSGLVPYDLNAPFWSDGAIKDRHLGVPDGTTVTRGADGDWQFPNGTVIVKNFRLAGDLVETRHLMRHPDGVWGGYTYEWNAQQTEANRVRGGKTVMVAGQQWIFPSEGQCLECHTSAANVALGPEDAQLNKDFTYPSTLITANQLDTINHIMMFTSPLPGPVAGLPTMPDPTDTNAPLDERARAYLHTNCSQCHRPGGPTPSNMDLRYETSLPNTNACDVVPVGLSLGIANARLIAPGDSARSLVIERASRRDSHGMPPLGSSIVDAGGLTLLTDWINGLANCN